MEGYTEEHVATAVPDGDLAQFRHMLGELPAEALAAQGMPHPLSGVPGALFGTVAPSAGAVAPDKIAVAGEWEKVSGGCGCGKWAMLG